LLFIAAGWLGYEEHGCALSTGSDEGIIFPAASLSGKTTLSLGLMQRGFKPISDDLLVIDSINFEIISFPKPITIREDTIRVIEGLEDRMYSNIYMRYIMADNRRKVWLAHIEDLYPHNWKERSIIKYIIFPKYSPDENTKIEKVSKANAFLNLLNHGNNSGLNLKEYAETVGQLVREIDSYYLDFCSIDDACRAIMERIPER
jgi:hypothetical protein